MHRKLLKVRGTYITYAVQLVSVLYLVFCTLCSLYNCIESMPNSTVVINLLKAQRPKFNAYFSNLKGPKKVGQGPKFGPGAHGMDNPGLQYSLYCTSIIRENQQVFSSNLKGAI